MSTIEFNKIQEKLRNCLDKERFEHTVGVMYTAGCLAMAYGYSIEKAMLAGLLHDCAKCIPKDEMIRLCQENEVSISNSEMANKSLLHAKAGAILAQKEYHITDKEILHAIQVHTTGEPNMSLLDKIIYIADYIEPARDQAPHLDIIRQLAYQDIDSCVAKISYDTLCYLKQKTYVIDPTTELTYHFYEAYRKETE